MTLQPAGLTSLFALSVARSERTSVACLRVVLAHPAERRVRQLSQKRLAPCKKSQKGLQALCLLACSHVEPPQIIAHT